MLSNLKHLDKAGGGASANPMAAMGGGGQKDDGTKTTPEQDIEVSTVRCERYKEAVLRQCRGASSESVRKGRGRINGGERHLFASEPSQRAEPGE